MGLYVYTYIASTRNGLDVLSALAMISSRSMSRTKQLRTHAQAIAKRIGRVLSKMAHALQPSTERSAKGSSRFPVFEVPEGARMIPASRVQKALDEDGLF